MINPPHKIIFMSSRLVNMGKRYYFMVYNFKINGWALKGAWAAIRTNTVLLDLTKYNCFTLFLKYLSSGLSWKSLKSQGFEWLIFRTLIRQPVTLWLSVFVAWEQAHNQGGVGIQCTLNLPKNPQNGPKIMFRIEKEGNSRGMRFKKSFLGVKKIHIFESHNPPKMNLTTSLLDRILDELKQENHFAFCTA